jgi:hypothetical protein
MQNILFSGCSYVEGIGLTDKKSNPFHFVNIFTKEIFHNCNLKNIGIGGYSNLRIFLDTSDELISNKYDFAFVCWTSWPRHVFWLGLEPYETKRSFLPNWSINAHLGNEIQFDTKFLNSLNKKLCLICSDHHEIVDIIKYIKILNTLAQINNTKIYHINNLCLWDEGYFTVNKNPKLENLTPYTNKIINSENRSDDQITELYQKIHKEYHNNGSINENLWLNLYGNFKQTSLLDYGNDNFHPGEKSHQNFGLKLAKIFKGKRLAQV